MRLDSFGKPRTKRARALIVCTACLLGLLFTLVGAAGSPTSTTPGQPSFEAAAIRLESPHSLEELTRGIGVFSMCKYPTSHYFAHFVSLQILAGMAYGFDSLHILGAEWLNTQLYSVDARVEGDAQLSQQEMKPLLRGLLEDRFHLKAHEETRTEAGYELTVGKNGPKLTPNRGETQMWGQILSDRVQGRGWTLDSFALVLATPTGRPVENKTGLSGKYDIDLRFRSSADATSALPDVFTAVQERLGLKLVPAKVQVRYLVIDDADRTPTEN